MNTPYPTRPIWDAVRGRVVGHAYNQWHMWRVLAAEQRAADDAFRVTMVLNALSEI